MIQMSYFNRLEPGRAERSNAFGVEFWYVPQKGTEVWMRVLLQSLEDGGEAVSREHWRKLKDFFCALGAEASSGQTCVSVTVGSETCWLQLQFARVNGTPVVWVTDITESRKIRLLGQIALENVLSMESMKRGLFFYAADLTDNAILYCVRRSRGSVLSAVETYDQLVSVLSICRMVR